MLQKKKILHSIQFSLTISTLTPAMSRIHYWYRNMWMTFTRICIIWKRFMQSRKIIWTVKAMCCQKCVPFSWIGSTRSICSIILFRKHSTWQSQSLIAISRLILAIIFATFEHNLQIWRIFNIFPSTDGKNDVAPKFAIGWCCRPIHFVEIWRALSTRNFWLRVHHRRYIHQASGHRNGKTHSQGSHSLNWHLLLITIRC